MTEVLEQDFNEELQPQGSVEIPEPKKIQDPEWCFQFFNNEPVVMGWQEDGNAEASPLVMQVQPIEGQGLTFRQNGMEFRIFAREISEQSKLERAEQISLQQENNAK